MQHLPRIRLQAGARRSHDPGSGFLANWRGKSVGELFGYIRTMMPPGGGGSLSGNDYLQVTAYLLKANDLPSAQAAQLDLASRIDPAH